jgi:hypothetical protein
MSIFPDQVHIERIAEALWRKSPLGNAALMVGAGLSRNARNIAALGRMMPTWSELAKSLCEKLYPPDDQSVAHHRDQALAKASSTSGALRLAQEFEASFGRTELNRLLKIFAPDNDYAPSNLHTELLKLPWTDVYTTNWDTLLERTLDTVVDRRYDVVRTRDDIPASQQPRIVKLHGSFPSNYPFIFTEEDYRSYPTRFVHFVNMVQQSMMENLFCLIGFSGDDPNFLHWSGWVRDNLGESAPKIYLVGWLELAPVQRRMLEERNIVPVDLSRLPQGRKWPEECRHGYALEWLFWVLKLKRPTPHNEYTNWIDHSPKPPVYLEISPDLFPIARDEKQFSSDISGPGKEKERLEAIRSLIPMWRSERKGYEGWVVAPARVRNTFWAYTESWVGDLVITADHMPPSEKLFALREMVWRLVLCLVPLLDELIQPIERVLDDIDPNRCKCLRDGKEVKWPDHDWPEARNAWLLVAIALLRHYRQNGLIGPFETLALKVENLKGCKDSFDALTYQRSMFALQRMDYRTLKEFLHRWPVENSDPIWAIRKAGILFEIDEFEAAYELLTVALPTIRRSIRRDSDDFSALSREGCAMQLLEIAGWERRFRSSEAIGENEKINTHNPDWAARWKTLLGKDCDVRAEWQKLCSILEAAAPDTRSGKEVREREFDIGQMITTHQFGGGEQLLPAYHPLIFTELVGMPSHISTGIRMNVGSNGLNSAALWLKQADPALAVRILMRTCSSESDKVLKEVVKRETIALFDENTAEDFVDIFMQGIDQLAPGMASDKKHLGQLRVAMELLSRLVLRLADPEKPKKAFDLAVNLIHNHSVSGHPWLAGALSNLLRRTMECISRHEKFDLVLPLLNLPTKGIDEQAFEPEPWWRTPSDTEKEKIRLNREAQAEAWTEVVRHLLTGVGKQESRPRAAIRLTFLHHCEVLSKDEQGAFTKALWTKKFLSSTGLPGQTELRSWVFLYLPEPEVGMAEQLIKKAYLTKAGAEKKSLKNYLFEIGNILNMARTRKAPLSLTDEEKAVVKSMVVKWSQEKYTPSTDTFMMRDRANDSEIPKLLGTAELLPFLNLTDKDLALIKSRVDTLVNDGIACYIIYPPLLSHSPEFSNSLIDHLKSGIIGDDQNFAVDAVNGLVYWMSLAETGHTELPPAEIIEEIGLTIYLRHEPVLAQALEFAALLFEKQHDLAKKAIGQHVLSGLACLFESCDYGQAIESGLADRIDIPFVRRSCTKLATVMLKDVYSGNTVLIKWIEAAKDDPLPELRNLVDKLGLS